MHRVSLPSAGLGLVISLAAAAPSHAQSRITLSPVEVIAPDRYAAPPRKPRLLMQSDRRAAQPAEPTAGATARAVAAAARAASATPSPPAAASEKRVSGAEVNARP